MRKFVPAFLTLAVLGCATQVKLVNREVDPDGPNPDEPNSAALYRYMQRVNADGTMPGNALMTAKKQRDAMIADQAKRDAPQDQFVFSWLGPGNIGGRIRAIIVHPTQPNIMWLGSAGGGIWKTTNSGASWFALDDFLASLSVGCMAIDMIDPNNIYAGTGEGFFETVEGSSNTAAIRGAGVFKSTDGGTTWNQIASTATPDWYFVNRLAIHPFNPQLILAATNTGIFRSIDAGMTWTQTYSGQCYDVEYNPNDPYKGVAGLHQASPLSTIDGGLTWQSAVGASGHRVELRYAASNPSIVYAAVSQNDLITVHRSLDGGLSYSLQTTNAGVSTYASYNNVLWVDPINPQRLIVGGVSLYRSNDAGATMPLQFGTVHLDQHAITQHPQFDGVSNKTLFFGCDGGIYRTTDAYGNSATELNNTLGITQFYGAAVNASTGVVLAGAQDNGTVRFAGNTEGWTSTFGGDGGYCAADPTDPNYFYGEVQRLFIIRSTNAGVSGNYIYNGITDAGSLLCNFIPYYMLDPNQPNRMLAGGRRLWRTDNVKTASPTWAIIKQTIEPAPPPNLPGSGPPQDHFAENSPYNISTIAVSEGDSNLVWVGYNNGQVWKSTNGAAANPTWTRVDQAVSGTSLPARWISRIVIDRINHNRVHVSLMGWAGDNVWRTTDGGATWTDVSGSGVTGLPDTPVASLAQHRTQPNHLYAGTDIGLFFTGDGGQTWSAVATPGGPGTVPIDELVWKNNTVLMVVTHGRGIFNAAVSTTIVGDVNGDGFVNVNDLLAVINSWGQCVPNQSCPADLNGNGYVNVDDLLLVITHWS